jgi:hypothetical protein
MSELFNIALVPCFIIVMIRWDTKAISMIIFLIFIVTVFYTVSVLKVITISFPLEHGTRMLVHGTARHVLTVTFSQS